MTLLVDTSVWLLALRRDQIAAVPQVRALRDPLEGDEIVVTPSGKVGYVPVETKSAVRAGEMQRRYRQRGGRRERTVPDFLVGAHALLQCDALITRDDAFFRDYFKGLKVIVPKAS